MTKIGRKCQIGPRRPRKERNRWAGPPALKKGEKEGEQEGERQRQEAGPQGRTQAGPEVKVGVTAAAPPPNLMRG